MLNVTDVIARPYEQVDLVAHLELRSSLLTTGRLSAIAIRFERGGEWLGTGRTDSTGKATVKCDAGSGTWEYRASAVIGDRQYRSLGRVYVWEADKPIVAIDIDETVIRSNYASLVLDPFDKSPPMPQSRPVIERLSERYGIVYISARARLFRDKTQHWLDEHGYPPGPIALGDDFGSVLLQHHAKLTILRKLRRLRPTVGVGIGDKGADEYAFLANDMKCIIINPFYPFRQDGTIVLRDWQEVEQVLMPPGAADQDERGDEVAWATSTQPGRF
jgi:hypothetical protein